MNNPFPIKGALVLCCFLFGTVASAQSADAQKPDKKSQTSIRVRQMTIMERYEPNLMLSKEERMEMKKERLSLVQERRSIIDTLDISDNKRRRLLKELYVKADDELWNRTIADLEFEEDPDPEE